MINIRQLTKNDIIVYRKARLTCLQKHADNFGTLYEEEKDKPQLLFEKYLAEENPDKFIFGAFDNINCIGLCAFAREERLKTRHRGEIIQMYVDEKYAGQGIGKKLLKTTIAKAFENRDIEQITLGVVETNLQATKLYEHCGFTEYAKIKNYFKLNEQYWTQKFYKLEKGNFFL